MTNDPRLFLAIDNCFASKRWTRPGQWIPMIKELGLRYVESSADTECDPLYMPGDYLRDWLRDVRAECARHGVVVANLYSGHGTYNTLGLAHTDARVRKHMADKWIKAYLAIARELGAGVGFYCHAFNQDVLQDAALYRREVESLYETLLDISQYNREIGGGNISVEQMYTPHQYPWTIESASDMICRAGVRVTLDAGHQTGQDRFLKPSPEQVEIACAPGGGYIWVGTEAAHKLQREAQAGRLSVPRAVNGILDDMSQNPQLFSKPEDSNLYAWLENLGCYSPILHLQQTNGRQSKHDSFSFFAGPDDKVHPEAVLEALARSYGQGRGAYAAAGAGNAGNAATEAGNAGNAATGAGNTGSAAVCAYNAGKSIDSGVSKQCDAGRSIDSGVSKCETIFLTLELFYSTSAYPAEIVSRLRESVAFWRAFIPEDGMRLSEALSRIRMHELRKGGRCP